MNLEQIQKQLIEDFDFEKVLQILSKIGEEYTKEDLIQNANSLIKMAYTSREMHDIVFTAGYLEVTRAYINEEEVGYNLSFLLEESSSLSYYLEKPFSSKIQEEKQLLLAKHLDELLELNKDVLSKDETNHLAKININRIEEIIEVLN